MYLPTLFGENLVDNWFDDFDRDFWSTRPVYGKQARSLMRTDIREHDNDYEINVELPGCKKEDIHLTLEDGYLTISAQQNSSHDQKDEQGRVIRQERYTGSMARSFYVGDNLTEEDIKAKFENGVLTLTMPKKDAKELPQKKTITIEG